MRRPPARRWKPASTSSRSAAPARGGIRGRRRDGLVLLLVSAISAATGLALWVTALFVLAVVLLLAALFGWLAYRRFTKARLIPEETIAAAQEDLEWAQHLTRRG